MNEMYDMSIVTHNYGVIGILLAVFVNFVMLYRADDIRKYKRQMRIFTPISSLGLSVILFTGVVMMAAKHLDFSIENIAMIIFATIFIVLEAKRASTLKYLDPRVEGALESFKPFAIKIFLAEIFLTLSISIWMWI